jgi:hypothetical protein
VAARCRDFDETETLVQLLRDRIGRVHDVRMDARRAGHDRHRYQNRADKRSKSTHGREKGKRDARVISWKSAHCGVLAPSPHYSSVVRRPIRRCD